MNKENSIETMLTNPKIRVGILLLIGLVALLFILAIRANDADRSIKPVVATRTPSSLQIDDDAIAVTFADLEADPVLYRNQRIEVSGLLSPIARPRCRTYSGIETEWGLVNGTLLMNAVGYEKVVRPLPNQLEMRVEGIWRFYPGPVGCGKESREGRGMWYLDVEQILQPNPLPIVASGGVVQIVPRGNTTLELLPGVTPIGSGGATITPGELLETPTAVSGTAAPTGTSSIIISTLTPTSASNETTTPATLTATARATSAPGGTATQSPTATITPTPDSSGPVPSPTQPGIGPPPAPTATPGGGGYPGGTSTPYP